MRPFIAAIFAAALILPVPAGAFYAKSVFAEGVQLVAAEKKTKKKDMFSLNDSSGMNVQDNINSLEQSKQNITAEERQELARKQKESLALQLLEETRNKTFPNNQEARKFFGALKILLPQVIQKRNPTGWRCNAYYNLHAGGPQECSATCSGGTWIYETKTETALNYTVI